MNKHLVGHGGHGQTGEGVHAGGLEHQTPVLQKGFFQDVDVAVAVGHQLPAEVEFQGADGGVPIEEGLAVRGSHAVGAVEGGIQVRAHVVPEARFVGQVGKVSLATLRQAEGLGQGGQLHGKEVERVDKSQVQAPPHLHVHQLGAVEQHGLGTHGLGDQVVQDQVSVESLNVVGDASESRVALGKQANEEVPGLVEDVTAEQETAGTGTGASGAQRSAALATFRIGFPGGVVTGGTDGVGHHQIGHVSSSTADVRETVSTGPAGATKEVFRAVGTVRLGSAAVAFFAFVHLVLTRLEVVKHVLGRIGRNGRQGPLITQVPGLDEIGAGETLVLSAGVQGLSVRRHFLVSQKASVMSFAQGERGPGAWQSVSFQTGPAPADHATGGALDLFQHGTVGVFAGRAAYGATVFVLVAVGLAKLLAKILVAQKPGQGHDGVEVAVVVVQVQSPSVRSVGSSDEFVAAVGRQHGHVDV